MHRKLVRPVTLIFLFTLLIFAVTEVEAKTYVENFYQVGGVDVTTVSPFPKGWKNSGDLWADDNIGWDSPSNSINAGMGSPYSQSDIDAVEKLDGNYSRSTVTDYVYNEGYAVHEFKFSVATTAVHMEINAYVRDEDDGIQAYIWNFAAGSWELYANYANIDLDWMWINFSTDSPSNYISNSGEVYVLFQSRARAGLWSSDTANVDVDYIEAVAVVPDSQVKKVCAHFISGAPRNWDGIFDDDILTFTGSVIDTDSNPVPNYPIVSVGFWEGGYGIMVYSYTNSSGYATLTGRPINGGITDKWRVNLGVAVLGDVMANGNAYQIDPSCSVDYGAYNVAVTPGSYDITLIGRYWDVGGGDWVRMRWIAEPGDVDPVSVNGHNIPVAQHFHHWDLMIWKMGVVDPNNDDNGQTEGVNGNTNDVDAETQPACIGPDTGAYCGGYICQEDGECCYLDGEGTHDCGKYLSGYRFGPLIQFNAPDHVLGVIVSRTIEMCVQYSTIPDIMLQPYSRHEGPDALPCTVHLISLYYTLGTVSTEEAFRDGYIIINIIKIFDKDPHSGLGLPGFIGLAADNEHVVGIVLGHRYGIHPFVSVVTSMPPGSYPSDTDVSGWQNFYPTWIYYLLRNLAYNIKVMAEELVNWDKRYPNPDDPQNPTNEDNIVFANIAFNKFLLDFLPYLKETLWIMEVSQNNTINTFIIATYTQIYDIARIVKYIVGNSTLRAEFGNVVGTMLNELGNIIGPPNGTTGLNYLLNYRVYIPETEKLTFNIEFMKVLDQITSLLVKIMKNLPGMELPQDYPWWGYGNLISNS